MEKRLNDEISEPVLAISRPRWTIWWFVRLGIGAALLAILLHLISPADVVAAFRGARFEYAAAALALLAANVGTRVIKWRYLVRLAHPTATRWESMASFLFGMTLGTVTPARVGEFGGRALHHRQTPAAAIIGLTVVDKLQVFIVMALSGTFSYGYLFAFSQWQHLLSVAVVALVSVAVFFYPAFLKALARRVPTGKTLRLWAEGFFDSLALLGPRSLMYTLLLTAVFYTVVFLQMYFLLNAFVTVSPWKVFLGFAAMMFSKSLLPISFGDLGVREASSVYFYSLLAIPEAAALNASLLIFVINILVPSALGLLFLPKIGLVQVKHPQPQ